jgi:hypothetical protein
MKVGTLTLQNGTLVETNVKEIDQSTLTSDCWMIQIQGLDACKTCDIRNTKECGGGATLTKMGGQNIIRRKRKTK